MTTAFEEDCLKWRGKKLTGKYAHWCPDWDDLPIDETCREWDCGCDIELQDGTISKAIDRCTNS